MSKEIDQLELSTATEIYKWLVPNKEKIANEPVNVIKARARLYLRNNNLTPYEALEIIRKQKSSMPKRIF